LAQERFWLLYTRPSEISTLGKMVEGDGCHRVAAQHRRTLVGQRFAAQSPNGRFKAGAAAIMKAGGVLLRIEVHGKNMFYFFGEPSASISDPNIVVVHIHFGMAGAFAVYKGEEPEVTSSTRLRLEGVGKSRVVAHLSAMTVEHGPPATMYLPFVAKLGPDPLRQDADPKRFVLSCAAAGKKPIGVILMDQSCVAGVGNIYRTETLYASGIHPLQLANTLNIKEVRGLWNVIVKQMQAGFKTGSIWGAAKGPSCYGLKKSACGGTVKSLKMSGRTAFICSKRQHLDQKRTPVAVSNIQKSTVVPGTKHLGKMVPEAIAINRKRKRGESLAVQHVALKDDTTAAVTTKRRKTTQVLKRPSAA